jgi:hypothetical protein
MKLAEKGIINVSQIVFGYDCWSVSAILFMLALDTWYARAKIGGLKSMLRAWQFTN